MFDCTPIRFVSRRSRVKVTASNPYQELEFQLSRQRTGLRDPPTSSQTQGPSRGAKTKFRRRGTADLRYRTLFVTAVLLRLKLRRFERFYCIQLRGQVVQVTDPEGGITVLRNVGKSNIPDGLYVRPCIRLAPQLQFQTYRWLNNAKLPCMLLSVI
jgi:hypothetical protein